MEAPQITSDPGTSASKRRKCLEASDFTGQKREAVSGGSAGESIVTLVQIFLLTVMSNADLLILTLYVIGVGLILYQTFKFVGDRVEIKFDPEFFNQQLIDQKIAGLIDIRFDLRARYQIDEIRELGVFINNNSSLQTIYIEWDRSCLINFNGRSQRVVRVVPGMTFDVLYPQVFSVIAPGKSLFEIFATEAVLQRPSDTTPLKTASPLIIKPRPPALLPPSFSFFVRLVLRLSDPGTATPQNHYYALDCKFTVNRLPWTAALPWNIKS